MLFPKHSTRPSRAALLFVGFLAMSSTIPYIANHVAILSWSGMPDQPSDDREREGDPHYNDHYSNNNNITTAALPTRPKQQQLRQSNDNNNSTRRRRLASRKPLLDDETQQKQMRSYLGGLYPPVDKNMLLLYLKDTTDTEDVLLLNLSHKSGEPVTRKRDLVFFWHIPKASGSTMKNIMNFCFDLSRAEKLEEKATMVFVRDNILNMDTSTPDGLSHAFANQLANSNKVDVIVSNYFLSASALFTDQHLGKTFTIMRHPVDVALSLFHYRRTAKWERSYRKDWLSLSFMDYVSGDDYMDNWMVRQLTGTMPWVELNDSHLERAKLMLRTKIFVGVLTEIDETLRQLKAHYGWEEKDKEKPRCAYNYLHSEKPSNANKHPGLQGGRGGGTWNVLAEKEKWDFSLYHYGLELFAEQRERYPP